MESYHGLPDAREEHHRRVPNEVMRGVNHRLKQISVLTASSCDAFVRSDLPALSAFLVSLTRVQEA